MQVWLNDHNTHTYSNMARFSLFITLLIISLFPLLVTQINAGSSSSEEKIKKVVERAPITAKGLSYDYYSESCPLLQHIVRNHLVEVFAMDNRVAPGILRLFFHDSFEGCDASILLDPKNGELSVIVQNAGFSKAVIQTIDNLRALIHDKCSRVVSCSDILTIAAREAVTQYGGPDFEVPLGRKDTLTFDVSTPLSLPAAFDTVDAILEAFQKKNLDATDLVALSGAHTYGLAHCGALVNRTKQSHPPIDPEFRARLLKRCPNIGSIAKLILLDITTPRKFDNMYYINLLNHHGVLTSDQGLASDSTTKEIVKSFASDQDLFFQKFADAFVKVSQLGVLTGDEGEIRKSCFATNSGVYSSSSSSSMIKEVVEN